MAAKPTEQTSDQNELGVLGSSTLTRQQSLHAGSQAEKRKLAFRSAGQA